MLILHASTVLLLGFVVAASRIQMVPIKVKTDLAVTVSEKQRLLWFFYRCFVHGYNAVEPHFNVLPSSNALLVWSQQAEQAFYGVKAPFHHGTSTYTS